MALPLLLILAKESLLLSARDACGLLNDDALRPFVAVLLCIRTNWFPRMSVRGPAEGLVAGAVDWA